MASLQEKQQWQAEEDAYTMARYNEIVSNKGRMKRAIKVASQRAKELETQVNSMKEVAKAKPKFTRKKK